jgi:hypothetical protein
MPRRPTLYIAGPMSGLPGYNRPAFEAAQRALRHAGYDVQSPHTIDAGGEERSWTWYMRRAIRLLLECDGVALLVGWQESPGASMERYVAQRIGMRCERVEDWIALAEAEGVSDAA